MTRTSISLYGMPLLRKGRPASLVIDGVEVPVAFRRNIRARRIILRMAPDRAGVVITLPPGSSEQAGFDFATRQAGWIGARLAGWGDRVPFLPGAVVPFRGDPHLIVHDAGLRGTVRREQSADGDHRLRVAGRPEHLGRRLGDWLKRQARHDLLEASDRYAAAMEVRYRRLSIRDQASRWGSCSSDRSLSYSWRLILAPPDVLDYVAAHEVAHIVEMNHGPAFWALVRRYCPHADEARRWLKRHGATLHRYGD